MTAPRERTRTTRAATPPTWAPRITLDEWPTPLRPAPRLGELVDRPDLLVKRDDVAGLGLGGNKVRKLEFLLADALRLGCDTVVTTGSIQSNHCRLTAAAANQVGMRAVLLLQGEPPTEIEGNLLLDQLLGAEVHVIPAQPYGAEVAELDEIADDLRTAGHLPYVLPAGGSTEIGVLGYAACAWELAEQLAARGVDRAAVFCSSGTGATQAGLLLGAALADAPFRVVGVSNGPGADVLRDRVEQLVAAAAAHLGVDVDLAAPTVDDVHVGPGYGVATDEAIDAMVVAARTEGMVLDPVYTAKALAGMLDHLVDGDVATTETPVFLHTGGTGATFAYHEPIAERLARWTSAATPLSWPPDLPRTPPPCPLT